MSGYVSVRLVYVAQAQLFVANVIPSLDSCGLHYGTELLYIVAFLNTKIGRGKNVIDLIDKLTAKCVTDSST